MSRISEDFHVLINYSVNLFNKQSALKITDKKVYSAMLRLLAPLGLSIVSSGCLAMARFSKETQIGMAIINLTVACIWYTLQALGPKQPAQSRPSQINPHAGSSLVENEEVEAAWTTLEAIGRGYLTDSKTKEWKLENGVSLYRTSDFVKPVPFQTSPVAYNTKITVKEQDCLDVAKEYFFEKGGASIALVNFANPTNPGGGFKEGARAQEEQICFRTTLAGFMQYNLDNREENKFYPLTAEGRAGGAIHTPNVTVFREGKAKQYAFMDDTLLKIGVITSAAVQCPILSGKLDYAREDDKEMMKTLIRTQLHAAKTYKYDTVILGAFGCGVFGNPPKVVAQLYDEVIAQEFKNVFKEIIFAIIDSRKDLHNPDGNLKPFQDRFGNR